jgi:hypothetical protein
MNSLAFGDLKSIPQSGKLGKSDTPCTTPARPGGNVTGMTFLWHERTK